METYLTKVMSRLRQYVDERAAAMPQRTPSQERQVLPTASGAGGVRQESYTFTDGELGIAPGQQELNRATAADSDAQTSFLMKLAQQRSVQGSNGSNAAGPRSSVQGSSGLIAAGPRSSVQGSSGEVPVVDKSNPLGSLAKILGPSPQERAAEEERARQQKAKMQGWAGLFNGLRHLGNLYYTTRGAVPQQYKTDPAALIEQNYQAERERLARQRAEQRQYYTDLWNIERQAESDKRKDELHQAQLDYYGTRDETARMRAENERLKAEAQARQTEARTKNIETKTRQMEELHPLQKRKLEAVIKNTLHNANRPYSTGRGGGRSSGNSDPYVELATLLNDQPDVIGPILQQEGIGMYDAETKEFRFMKNATKGMVTTANRRARGNATAAVPQRKPSQSGQGKRGKIATGVNWNKK